MRYVFVVEAEVERVQGVFATKDEIGEQIAEALESADYSQWTGDNGGEYETTTWDVERREEVKS